MKILNVISWIAGLFGGGPRLGMEKKDQTIKKTTDSVNIQARGDEITSKADTIKTGDGSPVARGDGTTIYQNCTFIFPPEKFPQAKNQTKKVVEKNLPEKFPELDKEKIKLAAKIVTDSSSPSALSTAIYTISGMLSESSDGVVPYKKIQSEFYDNLPEYAVDYSTRWECPKCHNVNFLNFCAKCSEERPKNK
ncbi:MAG: hypothetical protein MUP17_06290 [candidate division Zixibacteria bacterium]|nr:hypothetical protein [candidate division Zixibacteria bacterium]